LIARTAEATAKAVNRFYRLFWIFACAQARTPDTKLRVWLPLYIVVWRGSKRHALGIGDTAHSDRLSGDVLEEVLP
jgi:hypothetical protein